MEELDALVTAGLAAIEGRPPDLAHKPAGCAFHPRCASRLDICAVETPPAANRARTLASKRRSVASAKTAAAAIRPSTSMR